MTIRESADLFETLLARHGVRSRRLPPPDRPPIDEIESNALLRADEFARHYPPETGAEVWLLRRAGLACSRLDDLQTQRAEARADRIRRAVSHWDEERRSLAERTAAKLNRSPGEVVARLKCTRQGVEWLIRCWEGLRAVLMRCGVWDKAQWRLVLNLLGTRPELRDEVRLQLEERSPEDRLKIVDDELDWLRSYLETRMIPLDKGWRIYTEKGVFFQPDENERALMRQENQQRQALNATFRELRHANKALARQLFGRPQPGPPPEPPMSPAAPTSVARVSDSATPPVPTSASLVESLEKPGHAPSQTARTRIESPVAAPGTGSGSGSGARNHQPDPARPNASRNLPRESGGMADTPGPSEAELCAENRQRLDAFCTRWEPKKHLYESIPWIPAPGDGTWTPLGDLAESNPPRPPPDSDLVVTPLTRFRRQAP